MKTLAAEHRLARGAREKNRTSGGSGKGRLRAFQTAEAAGWRTVEDRRHGSRLSGEIFRKRWLRTQGWSHSREDELVEGEGGGAGGRDKGEETRERTSLMVQRPKRGW